VVIATVLNADSAWAVLAGIPDPEMPAISIVDLGIVREVLVDRDDCLVRLTPTYSACPALAAIEASVKEALLAAGFCRVRTERVLSPAWSSDWITASGRDHLALGGIAPPHQVAWIDGRSGRAVACPRCASLRTGLLAQFGGTACKALYRCLDCLEPFDYFKPH
jgi:ring-1,2-phenylacetyl-CoA epoxidase subunit PaaD